MTPTPVARDEVADVLTLLGIAVEKLLLVRGATAQPERGLDVALDALGEANDVLRDTYNRW